MDALVVVCPSCFQQFDLNQAALQRAKEDVDVPVFYLSELSPWRYGHEPEEIGLDMHRVSRRAVPRASGTPGRRDSARLAESFDVRCWRSATPAAPARTTARCARSTPTFQPNDIVGELLRRRHRRRHRGRRSSGSASSATRVRSCATRDIGMAETFRTLKELAMGPGSRPGAVRPPTTSSWRRACSASRKESARRSWACAPLPASGGDALARLFARGRGRRSRGDPRRQRRVRRHRGANAGEPLLERMATSRPAGSVGCRARPAYREEAPFKIHGGCGLMGICDESGARMNGENAIRAMAVQHDRGNGLGGGFAGYGIYPEFPDHYGFHMMYHDQQARDEAEELRPAFFVIDQAEPMPTRQCGHRRTRRCCGATSCMPDPRKLESPRSAAEDHVVARGDAHQRQRRRRLRRLLRQEHGRLQGRRLPRGDRRLLPPGGVRGPHWIGHNRFPTNTPGWWGGAHPFTLLDWAVVHNGEISSYGINRRYLEQFGYQCTLGTDTEVVGLPLRPAAAPARPAAGAGLQGPRRPLWSEIDRMPPRTGSCQRRCARSTARPC